MKGYKIQIFMETVKESKKKLQNLKKNLKILTELLFFTTAPTIKYGLETLKQNRS